VFLLAVEIIIISILNILAINYSGIIFVAICIFLGVVIPIIIEYFNKKGFYNELIKRLDYLDKKTLINEIVDKPDFIEGILLFETIEETNKHMNDEIAKYQRQSSEYMEYINLWVHEIKTPISVAKLIANNNKSEVTESMLEELEKTEKYVEQVLYYSKSFTANQDFKIEYISLDELVSGAIKNNAKALITNKVKIEKTLHSNFVYADTKWIKFIISQILNNSLQFMDKSNKVIKFYSKKTSENVVLYIEDNGIGIDEKDLNKIFYKGFVGENGRLVGNSTGFGLYICKKLCDTLNIGMEVESQKSEFTRIKIVFPLTHTDNV
jgi:hypothetical protein